MLDKAVEVLVAVSGRAAEPSPAGGLREGPRRSGAAAPERAGEAAPRCRSKGTQASEHTALTHWEVFDQHVGYVDWHREGAASDGISDDAARTSQTTFVDGLLGHAGPRRPPELARTIDWLLTCILWMASWGPRALGCHPKLRTSCRAPRVEGDGPGGLTASTTLKANCG